MLFSLVSPDLRLPRYFEFFIYQNYFFIFYSATVKSVRTVLLNLTSARADVTAMTGNCVTQRERRQLQLTLRRDPRERRLFFVIGL